MAAATRAVYADDRMSVVPGAMQMNVTLTINTSIDRAPAEIPIHIQGIMQQKLNSWSAFPVRFPIRLCGILLLLLVITGCGFCQPVAADSSDIPIKIGVLAHKGIDECQASWQPTIDYLNSAVPGYRFQLVPLTFQNISAATANHDIDFVLSNPGIFADLEVKSSVSNILTLNNFRRGHFLNEFGGVIIARKDRQDIRTYNDLKGKRIIAAGKNSFGGWYSGFRELKSHGIDPAKDFASLRFSESHPDAVLMVLNSEADAGIIRTDTLEQMEDEGKIKLSDLYVFPPDAEYQSPDFPLLYSTRLYPEWAFAKLPQTDDTVASAVAVALLSVSPDSPAAKAAKMGRWTSPVNYESVHDCLKEIQAPPYENYGVITPEDILRQYMYWIIAGVIFIIALLIISLRLIMANRQLNTLRQKLEEDINKRKRAEEELKESEERYRRLFENMTEGFAYCRMLYDNNRHPADFVYLNVNSSFDRITENTTVIGKPVTEVFPGIREAFPELFEIYGRVALNGKPESFDLDFKPLNKILHISVYSPAKEHFVAIFDDITEHKLLEEETKYHEEELRQFSAALGTANKKLTLLSGITRHDINNQLTVLMGFLELLEMKQTDSAFSDYFSKITGAAERIQALIQFTKTYEGIGVNTPFWQNIPMLVDTAAKEVTLGNIRVEKDMPAGMSVFADQLIVKVFFNLMDNAVRYGGKITTIRFSVEEAGDCHLIVCEDDGEGVVVEEKEKIFERGFGKNTGLGLFLSREILSITSITIIETGDPGKGARFEMTVPKGAWR